MRFDPLTLGASDLKADVIVEGFVRKNGTNYLVKSEENFELMTSYSISRMG